MLITAKCSLQAQTGYAINDVTGDFPISKIINYSAPSSSFQNLKDRLIIIDFFGTWCVPCVKALPKLSALQEKYGDKIKIFLISNEAETKIINFIDRQKNFNLSVVVDAENVFTKYFQPPSYPYTVVIDKNGKVISIPQQAEMTEENINLWLKEQENNSGPVINGVNKTIPENVSSDIDKNTTDKVEPSKNKLIQLSQDFMYAAKTGDETYSFITELKQINMNDLQLAIKSDDEKKAFWVNLYNAYTQVILKQNPEQYKNRGKFFGNKQIKIAGLLFNLDDIEHGILRRSKIKWSLGYFNKIFPKRTEKQLRVSRLDYRLHFALNCGAKSCPPIAFYTSENINQQFDLATKAYLRSEVVFDETTNTVELPALMSWFRRDFGGKKKMIALLRQLSIIPAGKNPKIKFKKYDWTLYLKNYK
jgi:thiol-disulfide isomerase/thioredoxin